MLQGIPGVHVNPDNRDAPLVIGRCRETGRMPSPSSTSIGGIPMTRSAAGARSPSAKIQVYIDGQLATSVGTVFDALTSVHALNVHAIEVYRGVAQMPAEFLADACAVVAIWTK